MTTPEDTVTATERDAARWERRHTEAERGDFDDRPTRDEVEP